MHAHGLTTLQFGPVNWIHFWCGMESNLLHTASKVYPIQWTKLYVCTIQCISSKLNRTKYKIKQNKNKTIRTDWRIIINNKEIGIWGKNVWTRISSTKHWFKEPNHSIQCFSIHHFPSSKVIIDNAIFGHAIFSSHTCFRAMLILKSDAEMASLLLKPPTKRACRSYEPFFKIKEIIRSLCLWMNRWCEGRVWWKILF